MINLTVSTNGMGKRPFAAPADEATTPECHKASDIEYVRYCAGQHDRNLAVLTLDENQAFGLAIDLMYQLVDCGKLAGWTFSLPDRVEI